MTVEGFLSDCVALHCGDCLEEMARLAENSVDSCVTDPPYHLTSIVKRMSAPNAAPVGFASDGRYQRLSGGFMGKAWDGGDIAFRPETWAAVLRVLKPGAHLLAMGGTRTFARMTCAIEDAGFEIRDTIAWVYGSGFPKSHDVSKGIDKTDAVAARLARQFRFTAWMRSTGLTAARIDALTNTFMGNHYTTHPTQPAVATRDLFEMLRPHFGCDVPAWVERLVDERTVESENWKRRAITGEVEEWNNRSNYALTSADGLRRDIPYSPEAGQWAGWGTALKPAMELIVLARKPLSEGTVAANVLRWGTGAINVDGCRVATDEVRPKDAIRAPYSDFGTFEENGGGPRSIGSGANNSLGRWPANLVHDGSAEVLAAFPESNGQQGLVRGTEPSECHNGVYSGPRRRDDIEYVPRGDTGSAARFFYTAKADADDRLGSKHPTVKPLDLMQWLVRLVTPKGGTVLDPFAGTGTTGEAAWREGMRAVLIEAEGEYQADIRRRMALALSGPDERARESIKAKGLQVDHGPLFNWMT